MREEHIAEAVPWDRNLEVMHLLCPHCDNCSPKSGLCGSTIWQDAVVSLESRSNPMRYDTGGKSRHLTCLLRSYRWWTFSLFAMNSEEVPDFIIRPPLQTVPTNASVFGASVSQKCLILAAPTLLSFAHSCNRAKSPWMCPQHAAQYFQGCHRFPWASRTTACRLTWLPERPKCDSWMMCQ